MILKLGVAGVSERIEAHSGFSLKCDFPKFQSPNFLQHMAALSEGSFKQGAATTWSLPPQEGSDLHCSGPGHPTSVAAAWRPCMGQKDTNCKVSPSDTTNAIDNILCQVLVV